MQNDSLELSVLSIFTLFSFFIFFIIQKYSHLLFGNFLLDDDFEKPQAFHTLNIPRSGGLASAISFLILILLFDLFFSILYIEHLLLSICLFFVGFFEDIKLKLAPKTRLAAMAVVLFILIKIFSIKILWIELNFLQNILSIELFSILFVLLCFLFIINGSNLIDGFNGLLAIQLLIINSLLFAINIENENKFYSIFITGQITILLIFLLFNFPKAKMFMGDGGAYFFGTLTALNVILTNNTNPALSTYFYCIIMFYLFFEVFFSFFRKIYQKISPVMPDNKHLHMLSYKILKIKNPGKDNNYINSLLINFVYLILIIPAFIMKTNVLFCTLWFFALIIIYMSIYFLLYSFIKKKIDI